MESVTASTIERPIDLLIVIICYNVPDLTADCVRSLLPQLQQERRIQVAICENGSTPTCAASLRAAIEDLDCRQLEFVELSKNRGFAGGNNYIIRQALDRDFPPRYVLLLNADTIVEPGCLAYCLELLDRDRNIGAFSCKLLNSDRTVQNTARKFPTPLRSFVSLLGLPWRLPALFGWADTEDPGWDRETIQRDVDWLGGAALWLRGDLLKRIGPLDEDFVFYGEDIEICHRVWASGYRCVYDPGASIVHYGGQSNSEETWSARVRDDHTWKARYLVQRKCYGKIAESWLRASDLVIWIARIGWLSVTGRRKSARCDQSREVVKLLCRQIANRDVLASSTRAV